MTAACGASAHFRH